MLDEASFHVVQLGPSSKDVVIVARVWRRSAERVPSRTWGVKAPLSWQHVMQIVDLL